MRSIYLDHSATTPLRPEALEAMLPYLLDRYGNPSSVHRWGRQARTALDDARGRLAAVIGARPSEIVFTRGGTEADNLAVFGRVRCGDGAPLVCSAFEHRAVLAAARAAVEAPKLHVVPVTPAGLVDPDGLEAAIGEKPCLVSIMWVNNEIGTVQPVGTIGARCREHGIPFHSDGIQALGKIRVRVDETPVDLLSISAHKFGGPKGVGALYVRRGTVVAPLVHGGGQERGLRSGTEDVAGAVGMAVAAEFADAERESTMRRLGALRDRLERELRSRIPDLVVNGAEAPRVASISNLSVPGTDPEALLLNLDLEGLAASSGSACSSGSFAPSGVLTAMGLPEELATSTVRFSLGRQNTGEELDKAIEIVASVVLRVRAMAGQT